jgi:hypothetical protein
MLGRAVSNLGEFITFFHMQPRDKPKHVSMQPRDKPKQQQEMEVRHYIADEELHEPVMFEKEYVASVPTPTNPQQRRIQVEIQRLQKLFGRYVAYGLRLQVPNSTRRVLLFVSSILGGQETNLSLTGLQRIEKSLKLFQVKVEKLQAEQRELFNQTYKKRSPDEGVSTSSPAKRVRTQQPHENKPMGIDTTSVEADILCPTTLSPATQRVLSLPGVSPTCVMPPGRRKVLQEKLGEAEKNQQLNFGHGILEEPIRFKVVAQRP